MASLAFPVATWAQALPALEDVVAIEVAEYNPAPLGGITTEIVESRVATQAELEVDLLADSDGDGVVNFRDACALNPNCQTHADIAAGETDQASPFISLVDSMEDVVQWALEENEAKQLYEQEAIINIAEQAGYDAVFVQGWRDEFLEPDPPEPEGCKKCRKRTWKECKQECRGKRGREKYRCRYRCFREKKEQCAEACSEKVQKIKGKIQKVKRKIHKVLKKPRSQRPPGLLKRLFRKLYSLVRKLWHLIRWW